MGEWLRKLQESDEQTKRRAAIGLTIVSMTIVLIAWLFYFNTIVSGKSTAEADVNTGEFSFWGSMKNETGLIFENVKQLLGGLTGKLNRAKEYDIQPNN